MDNARTVYEKLCSAIDARNWKYEKEEKDLLVHFEVRGEDLPMLFIIRIDEERHLVTLYSPLPTLISEEKRIEGALVTCIASDSMLDGSFDYDLSKGRVTFKMTASYHDSVISEDLLDYMIGCSCAMVDKFNDMFFAFNEGLIDVDRFKSMT